ncbi:hypothetical protein BJV78DRAFT_1156931 [Lactifluus subvellereus]|nr:hypothetical protein BJV78DRAFT_1156931 [Lactifluus subvellereus]
MVHKLERVAVMWPGYNVGERGAQAGCVTDSWIGPGTAIGVRKRGRRGKALPEWDTGVEGVVSSSQEEVVGMRSVKEEHGTKKAALSRRQNRVNFSDIKIHLLAFDHSGGKGGGPQATDSEKQGYFNREGLLELTHSITTATQSRSPQCLTILEILISPYIVCFTINVQTHSVDALSPRQV